MLTEVYDFKRIGESLNFKTKLPKSFIGVLVASLEKDGVKVYDIHDEGMEIVVSTSLCDVRMTGSWSVNDFKRKLRRVEILMSNGYRYYKEYSCFAKSEASARKHCRIRTGW